MSKNNKTPVIIRQSVFNKLEACPAKVGFENSEGYLEPVSEPLLFGTVQHGLIEKVINGETVLTVVASDIEAYAKQVLEQQYSYSDFEDLNFQEFVAEQQYALTAWGETDYAKLEFVSTELKLETQLDVLDDGTPVVLQGTLDALTDEGIYDWKTSGREWKEGKAEYAVQAALYTVLVRNQLGVDPRHFTFVIYNRRKGEWEATETYPPDDFVNATVARAIEYAKMIHANIYPATPVTYSWGKPSRGWYCSPRFCEAWNICPYKHLPDDIDENEIAERRLEL